METQNKRADIQALRGYAVLLVVSYHLNVPLVSAGYLGVDIFFVISGYLITGLIVREIEAGNFSFKDFYFRRAKRLLPAAYVTLAVTAVAAPYFLTSPQMAQFREQLVGALTFSANFFLWSQAGYFDTLSTTKPLLHFWSLAVEEQYYLLIPLLLVAVPARYRMQIMLAIAAASIGYCFVRANADPSAKFFLLHTRAWQIGLGSIGALMTWRPPAWLAASAAAALLVTPLQTYANHPPSTPALVCCVATLVILLRRQPVSVRPLSDVGDFSYSLYLTHWPIIAFVHAGHFQQKPSVEALVIAGALSFITGYLLYRFVERPIHHSRISLTPATATIAVAVSAAVAVFAANPSSPAMSAATLPNYGLGRQCDHELSGTLALCKTSEAASIAIWGDSHAMHLAPALKAAGIVQLTRTGCSPFINIAPFIPGHSYFNETRARLCLEFNEAAIRHIEETPTIRIVVMAGDLSLFHEPAVTMPTSALPTSDRVTHSAIEAVERLHAAGKRLVYISSAPTTSAFNIGACLARRSEGLVTFGRSGCDQSVNEYKRESAKPIALFERISRESGAPTIKLSELLCDTSTCKAELNGAPLYLDATHFTEHGSELIGSKFDLPNMVLTTAR